MSIEYSKKLLGILAGVAEVDDRFDLIERRAESKFYEADSYQDEVTSRRLKRARHKGMRQDLDEDPAMGQLSRRRVPMHQASAGVRSPQSYLTEPVSDDDEIEYGFGIDYDQLEAEHRRAKKLANVTGYGRGAQSGRFPGYGASIAGYISEDSE